jgi:hypothetical protein
LTEITIARIVDDIWHTPIYRYRHLRTGRRVTIIGTARLGTPGYYRILAEQIRRCTVHGALVYGEAGPYGLDYATGATARTNKPSSTSSPTSTPWNTTWPRGSAGPGRATPSPTAAGEPST